MSLASRLTDLALAAGGELKATRGRLSKLDGITPDVVNLYVATTGNDTTGDGSSAAPFKTIQRTFDAIPKIINKDHYINIAPGTYDEQAALQGTTGAGVLIRKDGAAPAPFTSSGVRVKSLRFYDINGYLFLQHIHPISGGITTARAHILFSRCMYASMNACYFDDATVRTNPGGAIPSAQWDGSGGSVSSNYFNDQFHAIEIINGSNVRVDSTNQLGATPSSIGLHVQAASAYSNGGTDWTGTATTPINLIQGGSLSDSSWKTWTPTFPAVGGLTYGSTTINFARYTIIGRTVHFTLRVTGTTSGTAGASLQFTLPLAGYLNQNGPIGNAVVVDSGVFDAGWMIIASSTVVQVRRLASANWTLGTDRRFYVSGTYELA